jgi:tRNA-specific 2-thiouridylase
VALRYRQQPLACTPRHTDDGLELELAAPAYGVAPGQLACLMDGELIVGHATIARPRRPATTPAAAIP